MIQRGHIDRTELDDQDLSLLARHGDSVSLNELWERAIPVIERLAGCFTRKYDWISHEDMVQGVLLEFPKIFKRYKPNKGVKVSKYLYLSFYRACQDYLRKEDPLGVKIPQKQKYPHFIHLSEFDESPELSEAIINDGVKRLGTKKYAASLEEGPAVNLGLRMSDGFTVHDLCYHGEWYG